MLIVTYNYYRVYSLRKQKIKLQNIVKKRTHELEIANTTKDKFFSIIAHDLRNPFNSILGYMELLTISDDFSKDKLQSI